MKILNDLPKAYKSDCKADALPIELPAPTSDFNQALKNDCKSLGQQSFRYPISLALIIVCQGP